MWRVLAYWSQHASAFVSRVRSWKRWLIMSLCEVLKRCSLRLFVVMQKFFFSPLLIRFWRKAQTPALHHERRVKAIHLWHHVCEEIFLPTSLCEMSRLIGSIRVSWHMDYSLAKTSACTVMSRNVFWTALEKLAGPALTTNMSTSHLNSGPESKWPLPTLAD